MSDVRVIIVTDDDANLDEVKDSLEKSGLKVPTIQRRIRQLQGQVDKGIIAELKKVPGVVSVEEERTIKLPPRGSPVQ
jgi:hypothetical protein